MRHLTSLDDVVAGRPLYASAAVPKDEGRTIAIRVGDLETEAMQQNAHILLLHRIVDQCVDQVGLLREQLGMEPWKPAVMAEDNP